MTETKLCACCFTVDSCLTTIGLLHLNACLYFTARFTCFTMYYWPVDLLFSLVYMARAAAFILMHVRSRDLEHKELYYKVQLVTCIGLAVACVVYVSMVWGEFGVFPLWPFVSLIVFLPLCNVGITFGLKKCIEKTEEKDADSYVYQIDSNHSH